MPPRTTEEGRGHQPETAWCCFLKFGGLQRQRRRRLKTKRIRMTFVKRCCCSLACAGGMHALKDFERRSGGVTEARGGGTANTGGPEVEARRIAGPTGWPNGGR